MEDYKIVERETFLNSRDEVISFKKEWGGHTFTEDELEALKNGEVITIRNLTSRTGKKYSATGMLAEQEYLGNAYWGFSMVEYIEEGEED